MGKSVAHDGARVLTADAKGVVLCWTPGLTPDAVRVLLNSIYIAERHKPLPPRLPVSAMLARQLLALPLHHGLTGEDQERVVAALRSRLGTGS